MGFDIDLTINDYLESVGGRPPIRWSDARESWDNDILHVTDLNACPLAVAKRLRGEAQEPRAPQESRKFVLANFQHELLYRALDWLGVLVDKEVPVPLPDGWSGTADMVLSEFYDEEDCGVKENVADSKNPVAGAKDYLASYPKPDDIRQVSVYSAFLGEIYPGLEDQTEGQVFYLPLGGASRGKETRFVLLSKNAVLEAMRSLERVRSEVPEPLPLTIFWQNRRVYVRKDGSSSVSGSLYHGTDWRCRYCRYACPNRKVAEEPHLLCKTGSKGVSDLTDLGKRMTDDISDFLLHDLGA